MFNAYCARKTLKGIAVFGDAVSKTFHPWRDFDPKSTLRDLEMAVGAFGLKIQVLKARTGQPACSPYKVARAASIYCPCSGLP